MFNRLFVSAMIAASAFTVLTGQTPEAQKDKDKAAKVFAFSFSDDGGYLGVQTEEVTKDNFARLGLRSVRGVAIQEVIEGSPAAAAGLKAGDVILRFNGDEITSTRKLTRLVSEVAPDHQVRLTILRNGSEQEISVTVGKRPMPKFENGNLAFSLPDKFDFEKFKDLPQFKEFKVMPQLKDLPNFESFSDGKGFVWRSGGGRQIGISVYEVTKQLGERYGVDAGVMINEVRENSPAAKAGLRAGDIVTEVDSIAIKNNFDLIKAINARKEGGIQLTFVRDRNRQTVTVTPEVSKDGSFFIQGDNDDHGILAVPSPRVAPVVTPLPMRVSPIAAPVVAPAVMPFSGRRII